ncbi:hypothetical protein LTR96_002436 [Exophiala xenobiotica]|nr:hypothetical protein LTR92_004616 [Exophiala xenobiotica]KAK5272804.1 hypothetical protein LTR96_002436 [Exophiala xenobiotica]KAK5341513.1 hypothetical protein LTR98_002305 [Exophiala xenobiotica]KAK5444072.1 hypothetical protein LTR18_005333 [Exophiala xenobiotica]
MDQGTTITRWQQAFEEYRIPTTRAIEKQLRASASRDKEKLRGLVGGSYRELLATAEAIVVLEEKTKLVEHHLSTISHSCRPPQQDISRHPPPPEKVTLAQFRLLQRCYTTSATFLRSQDILQCSKLILLSRLLLRSLDSEASLSQSLEHLKNRFGALRRQLLRQIDARLVSPDSSIRVLLDAICSYCLVTGVSSEDALAHLRQLRLEKLRRRLDTIRRQSTIVEALHYQLDSLQTFKTLTGRHVTEAANSLQGQAILADASIREVDSLDLDRTWPLLSDEIRSFVPYFKRSAPTAEELQAKFETWSQDVCQILVKAIDQHLSNVHDVTKVLGLRNELYSILLPVFFSTPASSDIKENIRRSLNKRLGDICHAQGSQLSRITESLVDTANAGKHGKSIWDPETVQTPLHNGGSKMIKYVKVRHSGLSTGLSRATKSLNAWISDVHATKDQIDDLFKIRWRDLVEEPDEDQEEDAKLLVQMLCKEDPASYIKTLQESLRRATSEHEMKLAAAASDAIRQPSDVSHAVYLVRAIRVSTEILQNAFTDEVETTKLAESVPQLHQVIAEEVVRRLSEASRSGRKARKWNKEQLPENMPSPTAFMTLRRLCQIMTDIGGTDLWCTSAVVLVKKAIAAEIFDAERRVNYIQTEFDEAYLRLALGNGPESLSPKSSESKQTSLPELEYWTRTKLLFGVLA